MALEISKECRPNLAPLNFNGGPTRTHALLENSPAIDAGDPSITFDANEFDQRGAPFVRVFDDLGTNGSSIDIGAFERQVISLNLLVDNRIDENDGDFSVGDLSLREAVDLANANQGDDTIAFDPSVFTGGNNSLIRLTQGTVEVSAIV